MSVELLVASLGPHMVMAVLLTFLQWHLGLFKFGGVCLSLLQWGGLCFSLAFTCCIHVGTIAVTATSLVGVLGTSCSVGYHFCHGGVYC